MCAFVLCVKNNLGHQHAKAPLAAAIPGRRGVVGVLNKFYMGRLCPKAGFRIYCRPL